MADGGRLMTEFAPGEDTARLFRDALGRFATGVTVVTCRSERGPLGITANSFASLSLDPPLVLWSPAKSSRRYQAFVDAERFAIHVLGDTQKDVCVNFTKQGDDFSTLDWCEGAHEVPLIEGCLARFECSRHAVHDGGDHALIIGRVEAVALREGSPLIFAKGALGTFNGMI